MIIAEPGALICFAGPRVVEQTIGEKLPPEAQKSEFLLAHGMIDCIMQRHELKTKISSLIRCFTGNPIPEADRRGSLGQDEKPKRRLSFFSLSGAER